MELLKYLGTTVTNENSLHEETEWRLKSGNACYRWCRISSSSSLSKNIKMKTYKTVMLPGFCVDVELCMQNLLSEDWDIQNCNFVFCFVWV